MVKKQLILALIISSPLFLSIVSAQNILSSKIRLNHKQSSIQNYIDTIQNQTDAIFVYSDIIKPQTHISIPIGNYTIKQVLDSLFINQSVLYVVRNKHIILSLQNKLNINEERIVISGIVISHKNKPIPFATIYFKNKSLGTIANSEGAFRFILPTKCSSDTLWISSIGYNSIKIAPNKYLTEQLEIKLNTSTTRIKDIIIRPEDPNYIVSESYKAIKNNYSNKHITMNAFFRESSKQDDAYISLSEALIEIKKSSYTTELNDLIRIIKGRNGTNTSQSELVNLVVEGGLYNGLRLDIAKYGTYFYDENSLLDCKYNFLKSIFIQDRQTYIIGFSTKEGVNYSGYDGKLYIDSKSLALVRAEFNLNAQGIKHARFELIKKSPKGYKAKPIFAKYEVEYRFYNNVWNLHYARSKFGIKIKKVRGKKNKGFSCNFTSTSEFVITGISDKPTKRIPFKAISKSNDVLVNQVENTETIFWTNENIILPEESLFKTIKTLQNEGVIQKDYHLPL